MRDKVASDCEKAISAAFPDAIRFTPSIHAGVRYIGIKASDGKTYTVEITVAVDTRTVTTDDGVQLSEGDRAFSHYTCKWGVIGGIDANGWFDFLQDDGTTEFLNGQRIAARKPTWMS